MHTFLRGVRGGLRNEFTNNNFAFFTRQETNSTFDLCAAINSLGKSAVGQSEHTHLSVKLHEKTQKWFFLSHQMLVKNIWPDLRFLFFNLSLMYMYSVDDFGSSRFMECTAITIHRTVFQNIMIHGHQKWSITASQK